MLSWHVERKPARNKWGLAILLVPGLMVVAGLAAQTAWAETIGIKWINNSTPGRVDGDVESLLPEEAAGIPGLEQAHWNNFGRYSSATPVQLFGLPLSETGDHVWDSNGNPTGLQLAWSATGTTYANSIGYSTPNRKLMVAALDSGSTLLTTTCVQDAIYSFGDNTLLPGLYVSGLQEWLTAQGADSYAVLVFSEGASVFGRPAEFWIQQPVPADPWDPTNLTLQCPDLTSHVFLNDMVDFSGDFVWVPTSADTLGERFQGNYMVFTGLTADKIIVRTNRFPADYGTSSKRSMLNAVQIVPFWSTASLPTVSITKDGDAAEPSTGNTFTISRTGATTSALVVRYEVSGTATNGVDYQALSGLATIPIGSASTTVTVTPIDDKIVEMAPETIIATVPPTLNYLADAANCAATMNLAEDDVRATTSIGICFTGHSSSNTKDDVYAAVRAWHTIGASNFKRPNWVNCSRNSGSTPALIALKDDTGTIATPQFAWKASGSVGSGDWRVDPNARLLRGYLDSNGIVNTAGGAGSTYAMTDNNNLPGVYVNGLSDWLSAQGADSYNILVYSDGAYTGGRIAEFWIQEAPPTFDASAMTLGGDLTTHVFIKDVSDFANTNDVGSFLYVPPASNSTDTAVSGNYTVFTGLTADSIVLRSEDTFAPPGDVGRAPLSAFQIWPVKNSALTGSLTVTATDPTANEPSGNGEFTITRTGSTTEDLVVEFVMGGMATQGVDYIAMPTSVTIPATQTSVTVTVTPIEDSLVEPSPETVVLTLTPRADYSTNAATVNLVDDEVAATIITTATDATATEVAGDTGTVTITRSGSSTTYPLTIDLTIGGSGTNGVDYLTLPTQVVIPADETTVTLTVTPIEDGFTEGDEDVLVIVNNSPTGQYIVGGPPGIVTITDDGSWDHWSRQRALRFGGYTGTTIIENIPVLVLLTPEKTQGYTQFEANGSDLRFLDATGTTLLPHEIEKWDSSGTSIVWVKVPQIASKQDSILMYSGNPGAVSNQDAGGVWYPNFLAVYHFGGVDTVPDSTVNNHTGIDTNTTSVAGHLGLGRGFNGADAVIDTGGQIMDELSGFSMSGWVNATSFGDRQSLFGEKLIFEFGFNGAGWLGFYTGFDNGVPGYNYAPYASQWHYVTITGSTVAPNEYIRIMVDGAMVSDKPLDAGHPGTFGTGWDHTKIGAGVWDVLPNIPATGWYNGSLDEVRFGSAVQSDDWVAADYASTTDTLFSPCGYPRVDVDGDLDVDQDDFAVLQTCYKGTGTPLTGGICTCFDLNNDGAGDGNIDDADVDEFMNCLTGPAVTWTQANTPDCNP